MQLSKLYIICCLAILCTHCSQGDDTFPPPSEGESVFMARANIGGQLIELTAGMDDYYMFTSYERDQEDVLTFIGDLKQVTCPEICKKQLRIEIRDHNISSQGDSSDLSVLTQNIIFATPSLTTVEGYQVRFYADASHPNNNSFSYSWDFGDDSFSTEQNPVHDYSLTGENTYIVELVTLNEDSCFSSQAQIIHLTNPEASCTIDVSANFIEDNQIQLSMTGGNGDNFSYIWNQDSMFSDTSIFPNGTGIFCLQLTDSTDCSSQACVSILLLEEDAPTFCTTSFSYEVEPIDENISGDSLQLSTAIVIYTDENGQEYRSNLGQQEESIFNIIKVENYELNEEEEKTKRLDVELNCLLYNENGTAIELTNGIFTFGLAHP